MKTPTLFFAAGAALFLLVNLAHAQDTTLTIMGSGNIGIGTTNPTERVQIGDFDQTGPTYFQLTTQGVNVPPTGPKVAGIKFRHFSPVYGFTLESVDESGFAGAFNIKSHFGDSAGTSRLFIHRASGNIGVGTTSPTSTLEVNGSLGVGDLVRFGNHMLSSRVDSSSTGIDVAVFGSNERTSGFAVGVLGRSTAASGFGVYSSGNFQVENGNATILGNVGVGTVSPDQMLSVNGNASKVGGGSWATFSDRRLKQDISEFSDGLSVVRGIHPVTFRYNGKLGYSTDKTYVGVIAQEIRSVAPYTVDTFRAKLNPEDMEETDILRYESSALLYVAINAIKELDTKVEEARALQEENKSLSARLTELEALVNSLAEAQNNAGGKSLGQFR